MLKGKERFFLHRSLLFRVLIASKVERKQESPESVRRRRCPGLWRRGRCFPPYSFLVLVHSAEPDFRYTNFFPYSYYVLVLFRSHIPSSGAFFSQNLILGTQTFFCHETRVYGHKLFLSLFLILIESI